MKNPLPRFLLLAAGALAPFCPIAAQAPATPPSPAAPAATAAPAAEAPVVPYAPKVPASVTLKDAFKGRFLVGVALNPRQFSGTNEQSTALILREFNSITAENDMKMGPMHPRPGNDDSSYNFGPADQFIEFGLKHNLVIIGHNLCWHSQMPNWMREPDPGQTELTKEVMMQRLKEHIFKVAGRYKGKVKGWDVVNEALADNERMAGNMPNGLRADSPFNRIVGSREYILMAFKWAHEADPNAELYYNDYNLDASDYKRAACIDLIKYLQENGARVTAVGMQGHYNFAVPTKEKIDETIGMFAALGVQVHVTELDVRSLPSNAELTAAVGGAPNPGFAGVPPGMAPGAAGAPGAPGGPGARGGRGGRGGLPPIDALKTSLTLTDAQVTAITPLLAADAKAAEAAVAAGDFAKIAESRNATVVEIRKVLNEAQQPQLTAVLPAPGGGRGRGPAAPMVPLTAAQKEAFSKRYSEIFEVFLKHKAVTRVTFWGVRDSESWRRNDRPLLFEDDYSRKPAYDGVIHALSKAAK